MRDAEFVLRFLTFRETWQTFSGGMMRHMDRFMASNQRMPEDDLENVRQDFTDTLGNVAAAFGGHAFQRWVPESGVWRRQVIAALYDAEMLASRGRDREAMGRSQRKIEAGMKRLFSNDEFGRSINAATNTPRLFKARIEMVSRIIDEALAV